MVKVDATEEDNKELAEEFDVKGFPTMKVCHHSRLVLANNTRRCLQELQTTFVMKHMHSLFLHIICTLCLEPYGATIPPPSCRSFSFLQIFKNGNRAKPVEYDGPREADGIVSEFHCALDALLLSYFLKQ